MTPLDLPALLSSLHGHGYRILGPVPRDGAIVLGEISTVEDLPQGWRDRQEAGTYRLERSTSGGYFGFTVGPQSWKKYLFPPRERLFTAQRDDNSFVVSEEPAEPRPMAFLGVRACDLAAIAIQDRVFMGGPARDRAYASRREAAFLVAVGCSHAGGTCFCSSMGTGPEVRKGFDLNLTEIASGPEPSILVEVGSPRGAEIAASLPLRTVRPEENRAAQEQEALTRSSMGRRMDAADLKGLLQGQPEHPEWAAVAARCLSCTNCTMACPTCFCHSTEEVPDLDASKVERWRRWDSCFNLAFSEVHGGSVRIHTQARYRQWLTHKLSTWYDQFGSSGCVGCGRCITWCPVGIDLTQEVERIRKGPPSKPGEANHP